ncbi:DUF2690 domain-containing protein [Shimazuella kribbensis]|uniref:DUF2690 domain-containing protein n=1 Tax=Shimazuella kribbensis TaxID=139808 RepID=UPI000685745D|nr:DUF2690 domain-containing protein [Shimazuella kribbensis]
MAYQKIVSRLFLVLVGAVLLLSFPLNASAANYSYDGKSPTGTNCDDTGYTPTGKSKSFSHFGISGTVHLKFSSKCKTAWVYVVLNSKLPSGYRVQGSVIRNNDGKEFICSDSGGNGAIQPTEQSCYSPMVYDYNPNTAYALVAVTQNPDSVFYSKTGISYTASY